MANPAKNRTRNKRPSPPGEASSSSTPRLRFPEFQDPDGDGGWPMVELATIAEIKLGKMLDREKQTTGHLLPYLNNLALRWNEVDTSNLPEMYFDDDELDRFGLTAGDVVVCEGGEPGRSAVWDGRLPDLKFQKAIHRVRFTQPFQARLLVLYLEAIAGTTAFEMLFTGTGIKHLTRETFARLKIPCPSPAEQQKIADCLTSLDAVVAAQGRKVEALKAHKKGLMQQLFPREGETLPRLRFPEFREKGEWEPTTLEQLVDIQSGGTPSKANPAFWNGSIPWVSAKDMKHLFLEDAEDHISLAAVEDGSRLVPAGTLLMLTRGMTLLKDVPICVLRREMSFNQDVKGLRPKVDVDGLFLAFLLLGNKPRLLRMVDIAGHGTGKLNTDELKAFELVSPPPAEQQRIAACLSALDARLAAESAKLAALKTQKKGLMQQLFPSPEEK